MVLQLDYQIDDLLTQNSFFLALDGFLILDFDESHILEYL